MRHPLIFVAVLKQSHLAPQFIHQEAWRTILLMFLEWSILLDFFMPSKLGHYIFYYVFMPRLQVFIVVGNRSLFFFFLSLRVLFFLVIARQRSCRSNLICYRSFQGLLRRLVFHKNRGDCFARLRRACDDRGSKRDRNDF